MATHLAVWEEVLRSAAAVLAALRPPPLARLRVAPPLVPAQLVLAERPEQVLVEDLVAKEPLEEVALLPLSEIPEGLERLEAVAMRLAHPPPLRTPLEVED